VTTGRAPRRLSGERYKAAITALHLRLESMDID